jgi:hypothetical protein
MPASLGRLSDAVMLTPAVQVVMAREVISVDKFWL